MEKYDPLENYPANCEKKDWQIMICGYPFRFIQRLVPDCAEGKVVKYYPQNRYNNRDQLALNCHGQGAFCRFSVDAPSAPGVYLWVVEGEIIYIGEAVNLASRFKDYGRISPRNCFFKGRSTNCKMNKVVMEYYEKHTPIDLYFHETENHKQLELVLLRQYHTKYNVKNN